MRRSSVLVLTSVTLLAIVLVLVSASLAQPPASAAANLVQNPGFELPATTEHDPPSNWTAYLVTDPERDVSPNVHSGTYSAYLHNNGANYTQVNTVAVSTIYKFEAYSMANAAATEIIRIDIRAANGTILDTHTWSGTNHGWERKLRYITTSSDAWDALITLKVTGGGSPEAWFDDLVLEEKVSTSCFIATAAHSPSDPSVQTLRDFRDRYLVTNPVGRALVSAYYAVAPPIAAFIDEHPALKPVVRVALMPAVAVSTVVLSTTLVQKLAMLGGLTLVFSATAVWLRRMAVREKVRV